MKLNINDVVHVQLTDAGRQELKRQYNELRETFPYLSQNDNRLVEDEQGWSKWQVHSLMNIFGHMMHNGGELPFSDNILLGCKPRMISGTVAIQH